jgi:mannose-1-phosphate guanylyltransferase
MKAIILVGGYGTRLRPLTLSYPKPLVEFCNKAMVMHQIEALAKVSVTEVILAVSYQPHVMDDFLQREQKKLGIKITVSRETEPMGTAGPIKLAQPLLDDSEPFFVLNSDVTCDYPFAEMIEAHRKHGGKATILLTKVDEPSKFGIVLYEAETKRVKAFREKPTEWVGNMANAGVYLLSPAVLDYIELRPMSIEREVFPALAADGVLYVHELSGYWADIGQPKDYLRGMALHLQSLRLRGSAELAAGPAFIGNVLVDPTAMIGKECRIGPDVVVGAGCVIEDGVRLKTSTLLPGSRVKSHTWISHSIIGWGSTIGSWVRIENTSVLGEDVAVKDEVCVNGGIVLPHKSVSEHILEPRIVM